MSVWEDDNALFFKLAHLEESAGFLGPGPFGVGPYKYTATFYIPIYYLFGFNTFFYFAYGLIFYLVATFVVYKTYDFILGKTGGKVAGFLFACGFVSSESFIRLFNSIITSVSIILISGLLYFYWKFLKTKKIIWYFSALMVFAASIELANARAHYLVSVIVLFELIFLAFQKTIKPIGYSIIRLTPFLLLFLKFFIFSGDSRNILIRDYLNHIINGDFYIFYGLIGTFANLIIPAKIILTTAAYFPFVKYFLLFFSLMLVWFSFKKNRLRKFFTPFYICILVGWVLLSKKLFANQVLNLDETQVLVATLGGILLILFSIIPLLLAKEKRKLSIFLFSWIIVNMTAYSIYNQGYVYSAENRYLAHAFFALIGLLGLFLIGIKENKLLYKITLALILLWGFGNLVSSVFYQHRILINRSIPTKLMYQELMSVVPKAEKGDIFYFDLADETKGQFKDAVAVAQMPETTALAWRYGIDRYDIQMFEDFGAFQKYLQEKNPSINKIHTFFYSTQGLVNTTQIMKQFLVSDTLSKENVVLTPITGTMVQEDLVVDLQKPIDSIYPINLIFGLRAKPLDSKLLNYPLSRVATFQPSVFDLSLELRNESFSYLRSKEEIRRNADLSVSSQWQDKVAGNLFDGDYSSIWQADRVLWKSHKENIVIDLKDFEEIDRLVWVNGYSDQTPTNYYVEVSRDAKIWNKVAEVSDLKRSDARDLQVVKFSPVLARFIRMTITATLKGDAPSIAEIWLVPTKFSGLDLKEAERILNQPFNFIFSKAIFDQTMSGLNLIGSIDIFWKNDKNMDWQTNFNAKIHPVYDDKEYKYYIVIPAGGLKLTKLKLSNILIPGTLFLDELSFSRSGLLKP